MKFSKLEISLTVLLVISVAANVVLYWSFNKTFEVLNEIMSSSTIVSTAKSIDRQQNALASMEKGDLSAARTNIKQDIELKMLHLQGFVDHPDLHESISGLAQRYLDKLRADVSTSTAESTGDIL